jgi:F-type H+-transporting ATPase subunit delta
MKISRESRKLARELFRRAFVDGRLDATRVSQIADAVVQSPPRGGFSALKEFARLVRLELASHHALIQSAVPLDKDAAAAISSTVTSRFGPQTTIEFLVNPALIGGSRIQVGSDVWDGSVSARLESLKHQF